MTKRAEGEAEGSNQHQEMHWRPRDYLAAALLFLATAAFVVWQNSRVAVLWDLGYLLDSSWRMALGQMPYRDFPFAHAPLTFLIQAALIRLCGRHYFVQIAYAALAGGLGTVLTWRILLRFIHMSNVRAAAGWTMALLLAAPLCTLGIYSIYPHPIYDCDCTLAVLVAIWLLIRSASADHRARPPATPVLASTLIRGECHPERSGALRRGVEGSAAILLSRASQRVRIAPIATGAAAVVPLFFKQNIGLPFLAIVAVGLIVLLAIEARQAHSLSPALRSQAVFILAGMAAALGVALAGIAATAGLGNYYHWTVQFAAQRRMPGIGPMLSVYEQPALVWALPALAAGLLLCHSNWIARWWARIAAFLLIAAPFTGSLIYLILDDVADERADNLLALWPLLLLAVAVAAFWELRRGVTLPRLVPFFVLVAIHGTFLSQQLWGSTYALWPLLMLLVAFLLAGLPVPARPVALGAAVTIAATFLVCGTLYSASLERLAYVDLPEAPVQRSSISALRGIATPGPYLSNLDELVRFAAREIPPMDVVLLLPGEDPFYFATGRTPQFPVTLFDPATDPYSAPALVNAAMQRHVRWLIVKRALQIHGDPMPEAEQALALVERDFALYRRLSAYDVYLRK